MKKFDNAELELIAFEAEDVISTSGEPTVPTIPVVEDPGVDPGFGGPVASFEHMLHKLWGMYNPTCDFCKNERG